MRGLTERWPIGVICLGLALLAYASFAGTGPTWAEPIFWVGAALGTLAVAVWHWASNTACSMSFFVAALVVFGALRSVNFLLDGLVNPLGVWIIVAGLLMQTVMSSQAARWRR